MAAIPPENIPLPADSMVTVCLSDEPLDLDGLDGSPMHSPGESTATSSRYSSSSSRRSSSVESSRDSVDWEELERSEEQEQKDGGTDESTALLLARLEQENNAIDIDPKAGLKGVRFKADTRPLSVHRLKKLVNGPQRESLRYSLLPAPAMTELEFWAALVQDYPQTAHRLPTLTSNKIRGGVPPPLRGVVWPSIASAQDSVLHEEFERLSQQPSPYDGLIGKDVCRSFPNVDMFREKDGEGQQMLGRVLRAFSLYDDQIGYCQGLGFVVGPLLMHMSDAEAFCVLVRLMEHYDLRTCYTPDLAGLHLRIYQFQILLSRNLPELDAHFAELKVEPLYISQWFLSFFAVTCPLPMLLRIYDVILAEGATETLMRVALSLMQRNQAKLLAFTEFEDIMQFLLSRSLWDTYAQHADDMVTDFVSLTGLVTRESLQALEEEFRQSQVLTPTYTLKGAATSFLGRFWAGSSHNSSKSMNLSVSIPGGSSIRKRTSGNSLTSNMNSMQSTMSEASILATELSESTRVQSEAVSEASVDAINQQVNSVTDRDLHHQIEELLTALSKLQHQQIEIARDLQREREEREEERQLAAALTQHLEKQQAFVKEILGEDASEEEEQVQELLNKANDRFSPQTSRKRESIVQSKHQLRDAAAEWKEKHDAEVARCHGLMRQLDERETEQHSMREELKEARHRIQDSHREKQRLERSIADLRARSGLAPDSPSDTYTPFTEKPEMDFRLPPAKAGLREFRLGRPETNRTPTTANFSKRTSSLHTQSLLATDNHQPQTAEVLLVELVNIKTSEAITRQELEETKGKLETLRRIISGGSTSPGARALSGPDSPTSTTALPAVSSVAKNATEPAKSTAHASSASVGGFFSGWGKRTT